MTRRLPPATLLLIALLGCEADPPGARAAPAVDFATAMARIETAADTFTLLVEMAEREEQRAHGLMERRALPEQRGMIFLYPDRQPGDAGFWMFRTRIPLDIAFLDESGRILVILAMEPCASPDPRWCPSYEPGTPYWSALEVNRGYFADRGITPGDRVVLLLGE